MNISKQAMDAYHSNLSKLQGKAKQAFEKLVSAGIKVNPDMSDSEFMELISNSLISTTLSYGDAAGSVALDFFEESTGLEAKNTDLAKVPRFVNDKYREKVDQYAANNALHGDEFMEACGNIMQSEVLQQANRTMINAGKRYGLRFARVPQGGECAFCAMLASRGFVYSEAGANSHYHNHCKCKVVAGKPGTKVGGYDHTKTEKSFNTICKNLGIKESLEEVENNKELRDKVLAEAGRRNKDWLYRGEVTKPWYIKPREKLSADEKRGIDILSSMGFSPVALPEDAPDGSKNIDFWLRDQHLFVEHKNAGGGKHSIEDNLGSAKKKWDNLKCDQPKIVILTTEGSTRSYEDDMRSIRRCKRYYDEVWYVPPGGTDFLIIKNEG
ncbi:hypothetical protein HMPREF1527_01093 [Atopobium sp. oral taxon 199 str. F0494]|nr:hypothetical protein HMPREF1527_01093 [Atopobium sp. oral taxon 199 str. F0494]